MREVRWGVRLNLNGPRRAELEATLAGLETPTTVVASPGLAERYAQIRAPGRGAGSVGWEAMRTELRALIERVDFFQAEGLGECELNVTGKHRALLVSERALASLTDGEGRLGAGTGFEPVTFRL